MFCEKCGAEISETARFYPKCGFDRTGETQKPKERVEDNNIIYQIKPEFNMLYKFLSNSWRAIIYLFLICFVFTHIYKLWFEYPVSLIITIFAMLIYVVVKMILENMQYDELEYNFYATKVEYTDGFINKE